MLQVRFYSAIINLIQIM